MATRYQSVGSSGIPNSPDFANEKVKPYGYLEFPIESDDERRQQVRAWDQVRRGFLSLNLRRAGYRGCHHDVK
jgi:hypothetical protein